MSGAGTQAPRPVGEVPAVKSAQRVMLVLEHLAQTGPTSFVAIARALGLPNSSAHQLLSTLVAGGFVEFDEPHRVYRLGARLWSVAQAYRRPDALLELARPLMQELVDELGETTQLATLEGRHNVYLVVIDSPHPMRLASAVGRRLPAHATGLGKTLLAALPDEEIRSRLGGTALETYTAQTLTDVTAVLEEVHRIRDQGYGEDNEEFVVGCKCVARPVLDQVGRTVAAVSVTVPTPRLTATLIRDIHRGLERVVADLGRRLP